MREQFRVLLLGTIVFQSSLAASANAFVQAENSSPHFLPRTDANAAEDLKSLRYELSRIRDTAGEIDPLADYAKVPRNQKNSNSKPAPTLQAPTLPDLSEKDALDSSEATGDQERTRSATPPLRSQTSKPSTESNSSAQKGRPAPQPKIKPATGPREQEFRVLSPATYFIPCGPRVVWESCVQIPTQDES